MILQNDNASGVHLQMEIGENTPVKAVHNLFNRWIPGKADGSTEMGDKYLHDVR